MTPVRIPNTDVATEFLTSLIGLHPWLTFTMELPENAMIPFIGIEIIENGTKIETQGYRKATNTGLLLHFKSQLANVTKSICSRQCYIALMRFLLKQTGF